MIRPTRTRSVIRAMAQGDDKTLVEEVVDSIAGVLTDMATCTALTISNIYRFCAPHASEIR